MTFAEPAMAPAILERFVGLAGAAPWKARQDDLARRTTARSLAGQDAGRRHLAELILGRLGGTEAATPAERRALGLAREAVALADALPEEPRDRLRRALLDGLTGEGTLIPLFHLLRVAALQRARGFDVRFTGLADGTPHDLLISRDGDEAEVACETMSAEEGRSLHRTDWCALVDGLNPDLRTWLAAHPGRYVLKMTLPEGMDVPALQQRIVSMLRDARRQDSAADLVLKLDPLILAGAAVAVAPAALRAQFGPEAHLAVAGTGANMVVLAARAAQGNDIARAACRRAGDAATRLSGERPGIVALFLDDVERSEWSGLRDRLELEGQVRRFLTTPPAKRIVAVSCASRMEMFGGEAPDGELRFRNPAHPAAKSPALAPAIASSN